MAVIDLLIILLPGWYLWDFLYTYEIGYCIPNLPLPVCCLTSFIYSFAGFHSLTNTLVKVIHYFVLGKAANKTLWPWFWCSDEQYNSAQRSTGHFQHGDWAFLTCIRRYQNPEESQDLSQKGKLNFPNIVIAQKELFMTLFSWTECLCSLCVEVSGALPRIWPPTMSAGGLLGRQ